MCVCVCVCEGKHRACSLSCCGAGMKSLESVLRRAVTEGQPRRLRAWRKILILVEGVYRYVYIVGWEIFGSMFRWGSWLSLYRCLYMSN